MGRRNPFENNEGSREPAAMLPPAPSTASRDRGWEKEKRSDGFCQVGYRHVPVAVRDRIRAAAAGLYVSADEVGRLFLEFALDAFERGEIAVVPTLEGGKLTLFPEKKFNAKSLR